jgi:hypothetical protein
MAEENFPGSEYVKISLTSLYVNMYLVFSVFTTRPTSLRASIKVCVLFLWCLYYTPVDSHHQHRPTAVATHLLPVPPSFPGPS